MARSGPRTRRNGARTPVAAQTGTERLAHEDVAVEEVVEQRFAPLYRVICHDDPITTMDFVVKVLREVFKLPLHAATEVMLRVHYTGSAVVGRWPEAAARRKAARARAKARAASFPLTFTVERDD